MLICTIPIYCFTWLLLFSASLASQTPHAPAQVRGSALLPPDTFVHDAVPLKCGSKLPRSRFKHSPGFTDPSQVTDAGRDVPSAEKKLLSRALDTSLDAKCRAQNPHLPQFAEEEKSLVEWSASLHVLKDKTGLEHTAASQKIRRNEIALLRQMNEQRRKTFTDYHAAIIAFAARLPVHGMISLRKGSYSQTEFSYRNNRSLEKLK